MTHVEVSCFLCKDLFQVNPSKIKFQARLYCFTCYLRAKSITEMNYLKGNNYYTLPIEKRLAEAGLGVSRTYKTGQLLYLREDILSDGNEKEYY